MLIGESCSDEWEEHQDLGRFRREDADPGLYSGGFDLGFVPLYRKT